MCACVLFRGSFFARSTRDQALAGLYDGPDYVDPLRRALDRGSKSLDFIISPLVLDYIHVKFSCTLPKWASSGPLPRTINPGFYKYRDFDMYGFPNDVASCGADQPVRPIVKERLDDLLLRYG